jgi:hypothetical protein
MARRSLYEQFLTIEKRSGSQLYAKCPFHNDTNASFTINEDTNEWFCHGCSIGGKEVQFIEHYFDVGNDIAIKAFQSWTNTGGFQFPTQALIEQYRSNLQARPKEIEVLHSFGITDEIIEQFQIGHDADLRIMFPIKSRTGAWVNVRAYLPPHRRLSQMGKVAKVKNRIDCGEDRFFPYEAFDRDPIFLVEGEKDMLSARSHGLNAVTGTGGSNIPADEIGLFAGHDVYVMVDNDEVGNKLATKYMKLLRPIAKQVQRIELPVSPNGDGKDYTEFWQLHPEQDVLDYVVTSANNTSTGSKTLMEGLGDATSTLLVDSENVEQLNEWILLESMSIIGTDPKTYTVPIKLKPTCRSAKCTKDCAAQVAKFAVDVDPRQLVQFVGNSDRAQHGYLQAMFGCRDMIAEPLEFINVQMVLFQEAASFMNGLDESSFEHRYGMFLYDTNRLSPTQKYDLECMRVADPRSQMNYYVIRKATQVAKNEPPEGIEYLKHFADVAAQSKTMEDILKVHYAEWMSALNIEGRMDLFGALMLTFLSVTEIQWRGGILKGWLDTMVIGDTRTGKSQMAQRLVKALEMGSYINGENAKATGVIGGVQKMGESWVITWGAIPMNDRGLLIVDEASGLSIDDIKDLSATRSSGAVTINKIAKGEARARTRLIWLSNPRSGKNLEEYYWRGYGAFTEFIPVAEDQARYDLVLTAAREDVPLLKDFQDAGPIPEISKWQSLIKFAWTLEASKISYSQDVAKYISDKAKYLDDLYGGGPLVVGVAVHEKIIRLTCAIAILCGSIDQGGSSLVLQPRHVDYAIEFLQMCFDKPSLDYKGFIQESRKAQRAQKENTDYIKLIMGQYPALKVILASNVFRSNHMKDVIGADPREASILLSELLKRGLLKVTGSGAYAPSKLLIEIAKQAGGEQNGA